MFDTGLPAGNFCWLNLTFFKNDIKSFPTNSSWNSYLDSLFFSLLLSELLPIKSF